MTTPTAPEPDDTDAQAADTAGRVDELHPPAEPDGPHLTASAERRVSDDLGNLTHDG